MFLRRRDWGDILEAATEGPGCFVTLLLFLAFVAFLASLSRALGRVDPENRKMEPGQVWLNLLPVVNLVWIVVTVDRLSWSFRDEFRARGRDTVSDSYGRSAGLTALILGWLGVVTLPVGLLFLALAVIYGIAYWVLVGTYAGRLADDGPYVHSPRDEGW